VIRLPTVCRIALFIDWQGLEGGRGHRFLYHVKVSLYHKIRIPEYFYLQIVVILISVGHLGMNELLLL
jgi:hypothetical protein